MECYRRLPITSARRSLPQKRRAQASDRIKRILYKFCADVSITPFINKFDTPHGLSGIFISGRASVGKNCTILQNVTIGSNDKINSKHPGAPQIGNNVYIGAGAVLIGGIYVGDNVIIGANTTVVDDIPDNCTVVSQKARIIFPSEKLTKNSANNIVTAWNNSRLQKK